MTITYKDNNSKEINEVITPNFILPSIFIKKIRPFIPIETENYRKAFISSIAAPNLEKENYEESLVVQKSMSFFKNLGIDDEEIIINCIKRELFFEEFTKHQKDSTTEDFIKTEIAIEIDRLKKEHEELQLKAEEERIANEEKLKKTESEKDREINAHKKSNHNLVIKTDKLEEVVKSKDESISALEERLLVLERDKERVELEKAQIEAKARFEEKLRDWSVKKESFLINSWKKKRSSLNKALLYFGGVFILTIITVATGIFLKINKSVIPYLESKGVDQLYVWGGLVLLIIIEAFGRSYIYDKSKIKQGYVWGVALINRRNMKKIKEENMRDFSLDYSKTIQKPILEQ